MTYSPPAGYVHPAGAEPRAEATAWFVGPTLRVYVLDLTRLDPYVEGSLGYGGVGTALRSMGRCDRHGHPEPPASCG